MCRTSSACSSSATSRASSRSPSPNGLAYTAFSPLAGGLLTGKYRAGEPAEPGSRLASAPAHYAHLLTPETFAAVETLERQAAAEGMTTPAAALHFVLETPGVAQLIVAPRTVAQFDAYGF